MHRKGRKKNMQLLLGRDKWSEARRQHEARQEYTARLLKESEELRQQAAQHVVAQQEAQRQQREAQQQQRLQEREARRQRISEQKHKEIPRPEVPILAMGKPMKAEITEQEAGRLSALGEILLDLDNDELDSKTLTRTAQQMFQ
jgi:hypothetical protein